MAGLLIVLGGVLVFGGVTAAHVPAGEADAKVDPAVADRETVFATLGAGGDVPDLFRVITFSGHSIPQEAKYSWMN
jgi:hypothetical protein